MIIPSIVVPESISESLLYFPASVCGLGIGELYIPDTVVAIVNIPEITVPDFADCPFYVVLPPPTYYASSPYPIYQWDNFTLSSVLLSGSLVENNPNKIVNLNDSLVLGSTLLSANVINHNYYQATPSDSFLLSSNIVSGNLKDAAKPEFINAVSLSSTIVGGVMHTYRYVSTEIFVDNLTVSSTVISGNVHTYRYLSADLNADKFELASTLISGSLI